MTRFMGLLSAGVRFAASALLPSWMLAGRDPSSHGGSRWATALDGRALGRLAHPDRLHADGIVLGWLGDRVLQSPAEDNVLLLGVQRSGKTSTIVIPTLLGWGGAVVTTSTKEELVRLTSGSRRTRGPVWVFAPLDRDHDWIRSLGLHPATWNPVLNAVDCGASAELADHFTSEGKRGASTHWYLSAANLLTGLIRFAEQSGGDMGTVLTVLNRTAPQEYLGLAGTMEDQVAADLLVAFALTPDKEAGSIASTARSCLSLWIDERVRLATSSSAHELNISQLLEEAGTLYLVAPAEEAERCRPLFSALVSTVLRLATQRARLLGGVLAPRLLMALDEAANFARIPRLAGYASSGPGQGIQLLLCYHDLAQLEGAYGQEEMRTIWNNCRARVLLPGQGDLKTLEHFSRAIGDETRIYSSSSSHDPGRTSHSEQRTGRPLASIDALRRLSQAVLVYANAPPARLELRRWDQVPHWGAQVEASPTP